jgi:hypothetical protein
MPPDPKKPTYKSVIADNAVLIDWASAIYGIFWGVWLGFFADKLITTCSPQALSPIFPQGILSVIYATMLVALSILISVYSYFLVKWLWSMRLILPNATYLEVFAKLRKALIFWLFTMLGIWFLSSVCSIGWQWAWIGLWSTAGWLVTISFIVLADKEGWA